MADPITSRMQALLPKTVGRKPNVYLAKWKKKTLSQIHSRKYFNRLAPRNALARRGDLWKLRVFGFTFKERLGEGSFGVVYKVRITEPNGFSGYFACKRLSIFRPKDWIRGKPLRSIIDLMQLELDATRILMANPHFNILKTNHLMRFYYPESRIPKPYNHFIFMELCDGQLEDFIEAFSPGRTTGYDNVQGLPENDCKKLALQLLNGINFLHNAPKRREFGAPLLDIKMVHCDLKPDNVYFVIENGRVTFKLADFGFTQIFNPGQPVISDQCNGTQGYYGPEMMNEALWPQFDGYDPRVTNDIYAVGAMIFFSWIGLGPGAEKLKWAYDMLDMMEIDEWDNIQQLCQSMPADMLYFLYTCCRFKFADRFQSVANARSNVWLENVDDIDLFEVVQNKPQKADELYKKQPPGFTIPPSEVHPIRLPGQEAIEENDSSTSQSSSSSSTSSSWSTKSSSWSTKTGSGSTKSSSVSIKAPSYSDISD